VRIGEGGNSLLGERRAGEVEGGEKRMKKGG
jgi:hypothetical protein